MPNFNSNKSFGLLTFGLLIVNSTLFFFLWCFHHSAAQPCALHALVDCCVQSARDERDFHSIVLRRLRYPVLLLF